MKRIEPSELSGPRLYFTIFDPRIIRFKIDKEAYRIQAERMLKIVLLTKPHTLVCPASHMVFIDHFTLLKRNPVLLQKEMIIPALRFDKRWIGQQSLNCELMLGKLNG